MHPDDDCPCGTGVPYVRCCGPLHLGERQAETAEALMRSRYTAYAVGDHDYLWRTWHPRTRPDAPSTDTGPRWVGLEIVAVVDGQPGDDSGVVEFRAFYRAEPLNQRTGTLHERSRFAVRARRWFYLDGELFD